jgi:hypothetical protein
MEKLIYLVFSPPRGDRDALRVQLLEDCAPRMLALEPHGLSMNIDDSESDVPTPVPWPADEPPLVAQVSLWLDCYDRRAPYEEILADLGEQRAGYLVSESLYTDYGGNRHSGPRAWPDGERSPGVLTVTLLEKPDRMTDQAWLAHWHGVQSPVSEEIQPRARYVRNEVVRALTPDAPPYRGIVEEAWPSAAHVTDPMLFYLAEGSAERMKVNIERMLESVRGFLDMDRIRNQTMSEYLLKT